MPQHCEVYVGLRDEGTEVWRPVVAERLGGELFRLVGTVPDGESWQFQPGEVVRCREREFLGGARGLVAVEKVSV
jgi:hypothetical protein